MVTMDPDYRWVARLMPRRGVDERTLPLLRLGMNLSARISRPGPGVRVRDEADGSARVRVYTPDVVSAPAALLWAHGGGFVLGRPEQEDPRLSGYAAALGITVVSVRYRLAPEHPFPAGLDDCLAAWRWLHGNAARLGVDPQRVAVGGTSAGGGLAAALAQRLVDESGTQPVAQLLVYPMLDDRTTVDPGADVHANPVWNHVSNRTGWSSYLGRPPGEPDVPAYAVPARRDDLSGLPPTWVGVGTADLFLLEDRQYASRLADAGVPVELVEVDGVPHAFDSARSPRKSQDFWASQLGFLTEWLRLPNSFGEDAFTSLPGPDWIDQAPIRVEESVTIDASPSLVWSHIADHSSWPEWFAGVRHVLVSGRSTGVGGRRRVTAGPLRFDEVFTVWSPERHFAFAIISSTLPVLEAMAESVVLEPTDSGTRVTYRQGLAARSGFEMPLAVLWKRAARQLEPSLLALKRGVESDVVR